MIGAVRPLARVLSRLAHAVQHVGEEAAIGRKARSKNPQLTAINFDCRAFSLAAERKHE